MDKYGSWGKLKWCDNRNKTQAITILKNKEFILFHL